MNSPDLLSHFDLTPLPFTKEIPTETLLSLPSLERVELRRTTVGLSPIAAPRSRVSKGTPDLISLFPRDGEH